MDYSTVGSITFASLWHTLLTIAVAGAENIGGAGHTGQSMTGMPLQLEEMLTVVVSFMEVLLEAISVLCVAIGIFKTLQVALKVMARRKRSPSFPLADVRLQFGVWLALALEFQLGADILATTIAPTFITLGKLGAIALIRTFLNYFLNQELVEEYRLREEYRHGVESISHSDTAQPE